MASDLSEAVKRELEPYSRAGWDGEGAEVISGVAVARILMLFDYLPGGLIKPAVGPNYDGSVALFWDTNGIYLQLLIAPDGAIAYRYRSPNTDTKTGTVQPEQTVAVLLDQLRPVFGYIIASDPLSLVSEIFTAAYASFGVSETDKALVAA